MLLGLVLLLSSCATNDPKYQDLPVYHISAENGYVVKETLWVSPTDYEFCWLGATSKTMVCFKKIFVIKGHVPPDQVYSGTLVNYPDRTVED